MSRRLKLFAVAAVLITVVSYWFANPDLRLSEFHLLPLGKTGTMWVVLKQLAKLFVLLTIGVAVLVVRLFIRNRQKGDERSLVGHR